MQFNRLKFERVGPFQVTRQVTLVDYEVNTPGKRQEKKIYHINLLKKWNPAPVNSALAFLTTVDPEQSEEDNETDLDLFEWTSEEKVEMIDGVEMPDLILTQKQELAEVMKSYPSVFNVNPGRTTASERYIHVAELAPIRQSYVLGTPSLLSLSLVRSYLSISDNVAQVVGSTPAKLTISQLTQLAEFT